MPNYAPPTFSSESFPSPAGHPRLPLRIYVDDPALEHEVLQAIELWNYAAGMEWLELTHDSMQADKVVHHEASPSLTGRARRLAAGVLGGKDIWIPPNARQTYPGIPMSAIVAHELGHTMGLEHPLNPDLPWLPPTGVMWQGAPIQPVEVATARQDLGLAEPSGTGMNPMVAERARGAAVAGMTREAQQPQGQSSVRWGSPPSGVTSIDQGVPFAWYNEKVAKRFDRRGDPAYALASKLVFSGLLSRWRVEIPSAGPGDVGHVAWNADAAHYTYHHYVQDVNQLATALKSSSARTGKLAAVDKGQVPVSSGGTTSRAVPRPSAPARPSSKPRTPTPAEQHGRQLA